MAFVTQAIASPIEKMGAIPGQRSIAESERFLSETRCAEIVDTILSFASEGETDVSIQSRWTGNVRWAQNRIISSGDVQTNQISIYRNIRGAGANFGGGAYINQIDDAFLEAAVRRVERLILLDDEDPDWRRKSPWDEPFVTPRLWYDRTYNLDATSRADVMRNLTEPAKQAGLESAGYIEVSAYGTTIRNTRGRTIYLPVTEAQYSVTVRDPERNASGWAGVDWNDWGRVNAEQLAHTALEKCLRARDPVVIEPGRYETILEPQAAHDLIAPLMRTPSIWDRRLAEDGMSPVPFTGRRLGTTRIGERIVDQRISISADPMHPDCSFFPFEVGAEGLSAYRPVSWIERGVLRNMAYDHTYAVRALHENTSLLNSGAFRMHGGDVSLDTMIAGVRRGVLVSRLWQVRVVHLQSVTVTGMTRDGVWLIESGKVSKPVRNLRFTESVLAALNNVVAVGPEQRVFSPGTPAVVPPLQVREFNFDALTDAI